MTDLVGREVDRVQFDVERGKIREFAISTFTQDPVHTDRARAVEAGFADVPATATHVVTAGHYRDQRGYVEALGLDITRVVVGSVTWQYNRPLMAGDSVTGVRVVIADETKPGKSGSTMRLVTLETTYQLTGGEIAVRVTEMLIERGL